MNIRSSGVAACLLAGVTAGCGTVTASPSGGGPTPTGPGVHATAASSNVIVRVPDGELSLVVGLTGGSFAGARPGRVLITSIRPPCGVIIDKNEAQPKFPVPKVYPLRACVPERRFSVSIIVVS